MVGQGRLELPTSRLSGVRSNHLSYWPGFASSPARAFGRGSSFVAWCRFPGSFPDIRSRPRGRNGALGPWKLNRKLSLWREWVLTFLAAAYEVRRRSKTGSLERR
jgi:hypothetical protein